MTADLIEVAVSLPVSGTFTYRDPRGDSLPELGCQVVVPFGRRTVTGFVVGYPSIAPGAVRDILDVIDDSPVLGQDVLELCRWAARYYSAPLGEVLRTALPRGERVSARRRLRLTEDGLRLLERVRAGRMDLQGASLNAGEMNLLARLNKARSLSAGIRRMGVAEQRQVQRLTKAGLVEVGDEIGGRTGDARNEIAHAIRSGEMDAAAPAKGAAKVGELGIAANPPMLLKRSPAQLAFWRRLNDAVDGIPVGDLEPRDKAALKALQSRGMARVEARVQAKSPGSRAVIAVDVPTLNDEQQASFSAIVGKLGSGFSTFLLEGVTGSGKTEVYMRAIAEARARGKGALVLVPEIALTPQLAARFKARFGDDVAVLHSALPRGERIAAWRSLRRGNMGIALGARSAVFAPVLDLGIVVVDEEHDPSFKQEEGVRYHGRDLALVRAQAVGAAVVLGSATPSLESFHNAMEGRYERLRLRGRAAPGAAGRPLPAVEILNLKQRPVGPDGLLSPLMKTAIEETLQSGDQAILFLNRRGFATVVLCRTCGRVVQCPDCAVSMTFHRARGGLLCHYCGRTQAVPERCPACRAPNLDRLGTGTERVETVVRELFPDARVARLDRDTADAPADGFSGTGRGLESILAAVHAREVDILIGTQMVTKGHDFPGVTLVGVLQPDQGMNLPDFRASERTFQLLEQVAGRAGRSQKPGRVLVQTYNPNHPALAALITHDYEAFALRELALRKEADYPPIARLAVIRVDAENARTAQGLAAKVAEIIQKTGIPGLRVRGPAEAPIPRLRGRDRFQVWVGHKSRNKLLQSLAALVSVQVPGNARMVVDVDPQSVL